MGQLSEALRGISIPKEAEALVCQADELLDTQFKQTQYIGHLEAEIKRLREEKGISGVNDGLTFNAKTGTYTDSAGAHYCSPCLAKDKRQPLKIESHGWRCMICRAYFSNPDNPPRVLR